MCWATAVWRPGEEGMPITLKGLDVQKIAQPGRAIVLAAVLIVGAGQRCSIVRKMATGREDAMCNFFAHQPQRNYESQTRSLRIGGHCTSIRLEMSFWDTLEEIAAKESMSLGKFLDHAATTRCSTITARSRISPRCCAAPA